MMKLFKMGVPFFVATFIYIGQRNKNHLIKVMAPPSCLNTPSSISKLML